MGTEKIYTINYIASNTKIDFETAQISPILDNKENLVMNYNPLIDYRNNPVGVLTSSYVVYEFHSTFK